MAKSFKIRKLDVIKNPQYAKTPYILEFTLMGQRRRKFFSKKVDAEEFLNGLTAVRNFEGAGSLVFSQRDKEELNACRLELTGYNMSVLEAIKEFKKMRPLTKPIDLETAIKSFMETRRALKRRANTLHDLQTRLNVFLRYAGNIQVSQITRELIEKYAHNPRLAPRTIRNNFNAVLTLMRWLKSREFITLNLDFEKSAILPREEKHAKKVFTREQIERLFNILETTPKLRKFIPFFALQAFAGLRHSEAGGLQWKNIDLTAGTLNLPASIVKTGEEFTLRKKDLPPNLWQWLIAYREQPICEPTKSQYKTIARLLGGWQKNGLRHTFCTMHISEHGNTIKTALILRHRNQNRLWQNYLANLVNETDARAYFEIAPAQRDLTLSN